MAVTAHGPVQEQDHADNGDDHDRAEQNHQETNLFLVRGGFPFVGHCFQIMADAQNRKPILQRIATRFESNKPAISAKTIPTGFEKRLLCAGQFGAPIF
jgi:hypothetical protein